jgi:hypothetical protein
VTLARSIYTRRPIIGDYVLGRTGVSWNIERSLGVDGVARIQSGVTCESTARDAVVTGARADATDAWETAGPGEFRLIRGYRTPR